MPDNTSIILGRVINVVRDNPHSFYIDEETRQISPQADGQGPTPGIIEGDLNVFGQFTLTDGMMTLTGLYISAGLDVVPANVVLSPEEGVGVYACGNQTESGVSYYGGEIETDNEFTEEGAREVFRNLLLQVMMSQWAPSVEQIGEIDINEY